MEAAEDLKLNHGIASAAKANPQKILEIPNGNERTNIPHKLLAEVIEARLHEIFTLVKQELRQSGFPIPKFVIITGGTALLPGLRTLVEELWDRSVRIANPPPLRGFPINFYNPSFTAVAVMGLFSPMVLPESPKHEKVSKNDFFGRISGFLKSFSR
jgi:cell division protein FtsA